MIERQLYSILTAGLAPFVDDPRTFEQFLIRHHGLDEDEAHKARLYFAMNPADGDQGGPPQVIHGYPRQTGPFPCWAIVLGGDRIARRWIGDEVGLDFVDNDGEETSFVDLDNEEAEGRGVYTETTIELHTYVRYIPDVCVYYYHLLRYLVLSSIDSLIEKGYTLTTMNGRDLIPDERYLPKDLWIRQMVITIEHEEFATEKIARGKLVSGIQIDEDSTLDEGVTAGVTFYTDEG